MQRDSTSGGTGLFDDRGVSEVIGAILVFGLLVSLLAIVQTQAVPNANKEVEVKHSADVQGDLANLQAAITRSSMFGGTESTTVETGMTYPSRLILYNPPAVQGTLETRSGPAPNTQLARFFATNPDTYSYINGSLLNYSTNVVEYRSDYNRYQNPPTIRYEHTALVSDYGDQTTVEAEGSFVSGKNINLVLLRDGLQESQVRPATVTTYPVSAPAQAVEVQTGSDPGQILVPTNLNDSVWVSKVLNDQIDLNALQGSDITGCDSLNEGGSDATTNPDTSDGRYIVDCDYFERPDAPNLLLLQFQSNTVYDMRMSKIGFSAQADELEPAYITEVSNPTPGSITVEVRDKYNNPIDRPVEVAVLTTSGPLPSRTTDPSGQLTLDNVEGPVNVYLPSRYSPSSGNCGPSVDCAIARGTAPLTRSSVTIQNISANSGAGEVALLFQNEKDSPANISKVQLDYATQREERVLTLSASAVVGLVGGGNQTFSSSLVSDGPDSIESLQVGSQTYTPISSGGSPPGAKENLGPAEFRAGGTATGAPVTLPAATPSGPSETQVTFVLNEDFSLSGADSLDVAITVYYEDGSQATYTRTLFNDQGEAGQSP